MSYWQYKGPFLRERNLRSLDPASGTSTKNRLQKLVTHVPIVGRSGIRDRLCGLKWDYEVKVPELETSVFVIPAERI